MIRYSLPDEHVNHASLLVKRVQVKVILALKIEKRHNYFFVCIFLVSYMPASSPAPLYVLLEMENFSKIYIPSSP